MPCIDVTIRKMIRGLAAGLVCVNSILQVCVNKFGNGISISTQSQNSCLEIDTRCNNGLSISVGLVCNVGENDNAFEVFYVEEGAFIVEEGYFKVMRI